MGKRAQQINPLDNIHPLLSAFTLRILNDYSDEMIIEKVWNEPEGDSTPGVVMKVHHHGWHTPISQAQDRALIEDDIEVWHFDRAEDIDELIDLLQKVKSHTFK